MKAERENEQQQLATGNSEVSIEPGEYSTLDNTQPNTTDPTEGHSIVGAGLRHMNPGKPILPDNHGVEHNSFTDLEPMHNIQKHEEIEEIKQEPAPTETATQYDPLVLAQLIELLQKQQQMSIPQGKCYQVRTNFNSFN